jgi:hypothetical protein
MKQLSLRNKNSPTKMSACLGSDSQRTERGGLGHDLTMVPSPMSLPLLSSDQQEPDCAQQPVDLQDAAAGEEHPAGSVARSHLRGPPPIVVAKADPPELTISPDHRSSRISWPLESIVPEVVPRTRQSTEIARQAHVSCSSP